MSGFSSNLNSALNRLVNRSLERVAKSGALALRSILNESGFSKSEHLKNYEIFVHISGRYITYEIILDIDSVEFEEENKEELVNKQNKAIEEVINKNNTKSYKITSRGVQKRSDARTPARDARTPARDARTTSSDRLIMKEVRNSLPRSMEISKSGKLSLSFSRSLREVEREGKTEMGFPDGKFGGIVKKFMDRLKKIILEEWSQEFSKVLESDAKNM
jgi:hypothetical protein